MAGVSFLYGLWNLHALGGGYGVPTVAEAMMDIEACLAVLEHLSGGLTAFSSDASPCPKRRRVPFNLLSAVVCHPIPPVAWLTPQVCREPYPSVACVICQG